MRPLLWRRCSGRERFEQRKDGQRGIMYGAGAYRALAAKMRTNLGRIGIRKRTKKVQLVEIR